MFPFRNILFPTDFTPHAHAALKYAAAFARSGGGRIVLFSVQSGSVPPNFLSSREEFFPEQDQKWLLQLRADVNGLLRDPLFAGIDVEAAIVEGEPADQIARAVREYDIDLVTVVTHGRKGLSRALFGSTAEEIIAEAPCPVLTIRPPQRDFVQQTGNDVELLLNRVLLCTNFRASSAAVTKVARELAQQTGAHLHVVHVIGDFEQISLAFPEAGLAALSRVRSYVQERMAQLKRADAKAASTHVAEGRPYEEIVRLATETDADLIAIGTSVHASLFGGAPVLGAEIERVVRNAPCPVLCVPATKALTPLPALVTQPVG